MGASSSGLLDEAKVSHIKGLVDSSFQDFSAFYKQQYTVAYFGHLQQEVEPKKQERGLLLTQRPRSDPEDVLYQGGARFSTWDEPSRKGKEKYVVVKRNYNLEIHESQETFNRGSAAKLVLQTVGGTALISEDEARNLLKQTCVGILNGVKEDSSAAVSPSDGFVVYLHLPYCGHNCFLFQKEDQRHHFLSTLKSCIRHHNLDPWADASYESQAFVHALRLYRQNKGCYECWEMLLGSEEQVLAAQMMEEVLPWLQGQLQSKVKGKKMERIRLWLATVHAAHCVVLEQLNTGLEALREECRGSASANQGIIRSNLDQISSSRSFLLNKIQGCVSEEAEKVCSESISPYMSSILEVLTENIGSAFQDMRKSLQSHIDAALTEKSGGSEVTKKVSSLSSTGLEKLYQQVEKLKEQLSNLKERFGLSSTDRLVHCAHLDMEKLLDSAAYTFELFLRTSARLQPAQFTVKTDRAKERVLKQLDYDSRLVQKRLYEDALLQITLPTLTKRMDSTWKSELQQFEQYIFSDFSSFILVQNVYEDVLRDFLSKEIEKALQEAASKTSSTLLLDTSDLAISQYSLLGQTPDPSVPSSPVLQPRDIPPTVPTQNSESPPTLDENPPKETIQSDSNTTQITKIAPPLIVVTQQIDECPIAEASSEKSIKPVIDVLGYESSDTESIEICDGHSDSDPLEVLETLTNLEDAPDDVPESSPPEIPATSNLPQLEKLPEVVQVVQTSESSQGGHPTEVPTTSDLKKLPEECNVVQDLQTTEPSQVEHPTEVPTTSDLKMLPEESNVVQVVQTSESSQVDHPTEIPTTSDLKKLPEESIVFQLVPNSEPSQVEHPTEDTTTSDLKKLPEESNVVYVLKTSEPSQVEHPTEVPTTIGLKKLPEESSVVKLLKTSEPSQVEHPMKISLETLSEAIVCDDTGNFMQDGMVQQSTDRAVYLKGPIKENWELENQNEAAKINHSPQEDAAEITSVEQKISKEIKSEQNEEKMCDKVEDQEKTAPLSNHSEGKKEELLGTQPIEAKMEDEAEQPLDCVAAIRDLVIEVTEVEIEINPCP